MSGKVAKKKKRKENKKIISCGWPFSIMQSARNKPQSSPVSGEDGVVGGRRPLLTCMVINVDRTGMSGSKFPPLSLLFLL